MTKEQRNMDHDARIGDATYDPEDNKLRLSAFARLSAEDYARAKAVGFNWAPKQEVFYAVWSPAAEDLLIEWCGEIGDEDTSLADRAEDRAARFENYSEKRERDGDMAHAGVAAITENIPLGQPILVGHHSERRARKDAERIENGMRKAVKMWETAEYWQRRAAGALAHASYKAQPDVRARRIKTLESERRKRVAEYTPHGEPFEGEPWSFTCKADHGQTRDERETCARCKRQPMVWTGNKGRGAHAARVSDLPAIEASQSRWIAHLDRRLEYEKALLGEQGAAHLLEKKKRPAAPPLLNYRAERIDVRSIYHREVQSLGQVEMTKAEYARIHADYKGTRLVADGSHRVRSARGGLVFLTDSKVHTP